MLFPAPCSGATTHHLDLSRLLSASLASCAQLSPSTPALLPTEDWPPDQVQRGSLLPPASSACARAPPSLLFLMSLPQLQIPRERIWKDRGNQTSQTFPLLLLTLCFPISYWRNLVFFLSFPFQMMKEPIQLKGFGGFFFSFFLNGEDYLDLSVLKNGKPHRCTLSLVTK